MRTQVLRRGGVLSHHRGKSTPAAACMSFAADPLVGSIAKQYIEDRELHDRTAKEYTQRYATG